MIKLSTANSYQKGKSTSDCICIIHAIISKVINSGIKLYTICIDYQQCYDKIDHTLLWQKFMTENISSKMVNALRAMYSVVKSIIKFNQTLSDPISIQHGVKQGDTS